MKNKELFDQLPDTYKKLMVMDILGLSQEEIDKMGLYEYLAAVNYSTATYNLRNQAADEDTMGNGGSAGESQDVLKFDQPDGWNLDKGEEFTSKIELGGAE